MPSVYTSVPATQTSTVNTILNPDPILSDNAEVVGDLEVTGTLTVGGEVVGGGVPTGGTTGQVLAKASNANYDTEWTTNAAETAWGDITGTLSDQTDLQSALDAKLNVVSPAATGSMNVTVPDALPARADGFVINGASNTFNGVGVFAGIRARGTDASPAGVAAADILTAISAKGYTSDGAYSTNYVPSIQIRATEPWSNIAQGTDINFTANGLGSLTSYNILTLTHNGTTRVAKLGSSAGALKLEYDGSSTANRPFFQASSGTGTVVVTKAPGTSSSDNSGFRMNSSSDDTSHYLLALSARNATSASGAHRIQTGKVTPATITALYNLVGGSGYDADGVYTDVALTGGTGTGATANITISGGVVTVCTLVLKGTGYTANDTLSAADGDLGGRTGGAAFSVDVQSVATATTDSDVPLVVSGAVSSTVYASIGPAGTVVNKMMTMPIYTLGTLPAVTEGGVIYVSDATGASVTGSLCFGNASNWIDTTTGAAVV